MKTTIQMWPSGLYVDLAKPRLASLDLNDMVHSLSMTCRYGGSIPEFYSVLQHEVYVMALLGWWNAPERVQLRGLFHDHEEAYIGDIRGPFKHLPKMKYARQRGALFTKLIARRLRLPGLTPAEHKLVKRADTMIAAAERRDLLSFRDLDVDVPFIIRPRTPEQVRVLWYNEYQSLQYAK